MKLLSVTVPCYNSKDYMRKCIESLLSGGEEVELLLVDDGSTDGETPAIADEYARQYPTIIRTIHQVNKGHGGAVNTGLANATGLYFKVVDSDDWVDAEAYAKVLDTLRALESSGRSVDVLLSNYVYENVEHHTQYFMRYEKYFPHDQIFGWDEVKTLGISTYVLMHSIIYRTELVRDKAHLQLPEHTFYVDNILAFVPFASVKTLYYLNVDLYRYFIGRADQSVNIDVMVRRAGQQYKVNELMIEYMAKTHDLLPQQEAFMLHYLSIIMMITTVLYIEADDRETMNRLWKKFESLDPVHCDQVRNTLMGRVSTMPGPLGALFIKHGYNLAQKHVGFN